MAEFQEVMKQWRRFCKSHSNCGECEFDGKGICCETHLSGVPYSDIELRIMAWAAEHPVVYPTWEEWLQSIGVMESNNRLKELCQRQLIIDGIPAHAIPTVKVLDPIPADIAEKLGIEPKEVQHGQ